MSTNVRITGALVYGDEEELGDALEDVCEVEDAAVLIRELLEDGVVVPESMTLTFDVDIQLPDEDSGVLQDALEELAIAASEGSISVWKNEDGTRLKAGGDEEPVSSM